MKRFFLFLPLAFLQFAQAAPAYDSTAVERLIRQGAKRLQELIDANQAQEKNAARQFVLTLEENDYVNDLQAGLHPHFLGGQLESALNARLNSVYQQEGVECYLVLINALEVRLSAQLDTTYTLDDLFGPHKFFAEHSDVVRQQQVHDSIARALAQRVFPQGRKCLLKTIAAYKTIFYNDSAHTNFHSKLFRLSPAGAPELPYFKEIGDYMQSYGGVYSRFPSPGNDSIARVAVSAFEHAAHFAKLKAKLLNVFEPDSLENLLRQFPAPGDWAAFTVAERLHCFSVLLRQSWVNSGEEQLVVNLVKTTPENDVFALLQGLERESTLNTRSDFTVQSEKNNHRCLIVRLMEAVDDDVIGSEDDYYTAFCKAISDKLSRSPQALSAYVSDDPAQFQKRLVYWYNVNLILPDEIGVISYENVTLTDDARITFDRKEVVDRENTSTLQANGNPSINFSYVNIFHEEHVQLRAFDVVIFQNLSSLHMLESAGAQQGEIMLLPAIFIKYARDKQWNTNTLKSVALTVDVVTLATGPGLVWKAARAAEWGVVALEAAQIAASAGNVTVNALEITDPEVRQAVDCFNLLVGAVGFTRLTVAAGSKISLRNTADLIWTSGGKMARWTRAQAEQFVQLVERCLERIKTSSYAWKDKLVRFYEYVRKQVMLNRAFVASTGAELETYLNQLTNIPAGTSYSGRLYRSLSQNSVDNYHVQPNQITDYSIESSWGRYDRQGNEGALYLSATLDGNRTEVSFYGSWENFYTYEFSGVHIDELLDLTNPNVRQTLGVSFEQLTRNIVAISDEESKLFNYAFTNVISTWARQRGYKGLLVPGARGNLDYTNVIIFNQADVNAALGNLAPTQIIK